MKMKFAAMLLLSTSLAIAPAAPASAHGGHGHRGGGPIIGLFALGAAVVAGTVAIASAPFNAIAEAGPGPQAYYPPPYASPYAPPYAQAPVYQVPPGYYPAPQAYYAPPVYYRRYN